VAVCRTTPGIREPKRVSKPFQVRELSELRPFHWASDIVSNRASGIAASGPFCSKLSQLFESRGREGLQPHLLQVHKILVSPRCPNFQFRRPTLHQQTLTGCSVGCAISEHPFVAYPPCVVASPPPTPNPLSILHFMPIQGFRVGRRRPSRRPLSSMGDRSFHADSYSLTLDFIHPLSDVQRSGEIPEDNDQLFDRTSISLLFRFRPRLRGSVQDERLLRG
jgi:hypothetical protein